MKNISEFVYLYSYFSYAPESLYIYSLLLRQHEVAIAFTLKYIFAYLVTYVLMGQIQWLEKYWILKIQTNITSVKTIQYDTILGGVWDCSNTISINPTFFGAFGLAFPYGRVINKVLKLSAVLDWKIYHSLFITLFCSNFYYRNK